MSNTSNTPPTTYKLKMVEARNSSTGRVRWGVTLYPQYTTLYFNTRKAAEAWANKVGTPR